MNFYLKYYHAYQINGTFSKLSITYSTFRFHPLPQKVVFDSRFI